MFLKLKDFQFTKLNVHLGLKCVGKKVHKLLFHNEDTYSAILHRFDVECQLLSELRHPHIVQFLGTYLDAEMKIPVVVMEYLPSTLANTVSEYGVLPSHVVYSILHDVAIGLCFLHDNRPVVIHGNLMGSNVLLTSDLRAKISGIGVAKILDLSPMESFSTIKRAKPSTVAYIPPEVSDTTLNYSEKVDIFSFGILILHVFSGDWPIPSTVTLHNQGAVGGRTEVDQRRKYFREMGSKHPLRYLTERCLSNVPEKRPQASELCTATETIQAECSDAQQPENHLDSHKETQEVFGSLAGLEQHVHLLKKCCLKDFDRIEEELTHLCHKTKTFRETSVSTAVNKIFTTQALIVCLYFLSNLVCVT